MTSREDQLRELAADAALERGDFVRQAAEQMERFLAANAERIRQLGGLVLIDEEPDYLAVAPDGTFRSRTRYQDDLTGEWVSETEVIESAAELVELYNPADVYEWFAEAAREAAGLPAQPTAAEELLGAASGEGVRPNGGDIYAAAADQWAAAQAEAEPTDEVSAAQGLYDLALAFQERSQEMEARLLEQFSSRAGRYTALLGDITIVEDDDERLVLQANGDFRAEVLPEDAESWRTLETADDLVEYYDPTDVFGDLADTLAETYPEIAPEEAEEATDEGEGEEGDEGVDGPNGEAPDADEADRRNGAGRGH
jgi:hypothetical protein